jgi:hypothetical protein
MEFIGKHQRCGPWFVEPLNHGKCSAVADDLPNAGFLNHGGTPSYHPFIDGFSMK